MSQKINCFSHTLFLTYRFLPFLHWLQSGPFFLSARNVTILGAHKKPDHFLKFVARVYDEAEECSIYQTIRYFITTKKVFGILPQLDVLCTSAVK